MNVEICIDSRSVEAVRGAVSAAYEGGAATVELCAAMEVGGLTPPVEHIVEARRAFGERPGLVVMIRPHARSFSYTPDELDRMEADIQRAAAADADGVALGVLRPGDHRVDVQATQWLVETAHAHGLFATFHRAFDAVPDREEALDTLLDLGIDRILTCGIPWGATGTALDGTDTLARTILRTGDRAEVVVGGGVTPANIAEILNGLPLDGARVSIHAFSGAQQTGRTTPEAVRALVDAVGGRVDG